LVNKKRFWCETMRKFVSLILLYAFVALLVTGIVLYFMPPGRIAYWIDWRFLSLNKDQWEAIHILFGVLMLVFGVYHLVLNWRPILFYSFRSGKPSFPFLLATSLAIFLVISAVKEWPPASTFLLLKERFKKSWQQGSVPGPPIPHAELLPLKSIVQRENLDLTQVLEALQKEGIKVPDPSLSLKELAKLNHSTPARIYEIIVNTAGGLRAKKQEIPQVGRLSLEEVCKFYRIPPEKCGQILRRHSLEPVWGKPLREWTFSQGVTPREVAELLRAKAP